MPGNTASYEHAIEQAMESWINAITMHVLPHPDADGEWYWLVQETDDGDDGCWGDGYAPTREQAIVDATLSMDSTIRRLAKLDVDRSCEP